MKQMLLVLSLALVILWGTARVACCQTTTVQLPTFHQFGVSTTVLVPDRGTTYLGGVNRSSRAGSQFGLGLSGLRSRGYGSSISTGGIFMSATIIDHDEIDRALLAEAARRRGEKFDIFGRPVTDAPARVPDYVATPTTPHSQRRSGKIEESRREPIVADESTGSDLAAIYLRRGQEAEAQGETAAATIFYRKVFSHGTATQIIDANKRLLRLAN